MIKYLLIAILLVVGCKSEVSSVAIKYPKVVGDIQFDPIIDGEFERCDSYTNQYYGINGGLGYKGEISKIKMNILSDYEPIDQKGQSGFLTIRFVVNCMGQSGMFRTFSTDLLLNDFKFNQKIVSQLLRATKNLNNWKVAEYNGKTYDYYQYLSFKLIDSKLVEIAP